MTVAKTVLVASLVAATTVATVFMASAADANPLFWKGVVVGAAGTIVGSALFHPIYHPRFVTRVPVVVRTPVSNCYIEKWVGPYGRIDRREICS